MTDPIRPQVLFWFSAVAVAFVFSGNAFAVDADAAKMLARQNGCFKCHTIENNPAKQKDGPPWSKVAVKYRGKSDAESRLVLISRAGEKAKFPDGHEEDHKIIKTKDMAQIKNLDGLDSFPVGEERLKRNSFTTPMTDRKTCGSTTMKFLRRVIALWLRPRWLVGSLFRVGSGQLCRSWVKAPKNAATSLKEDAGLYPLSRRNRRLAGVVDLSDRHGVKADSRTPTCQSCHGKSEVASKGRSESKRVAQDRTSFSVARARRTRRPRRMLRVRSVSTATSPGCGCSGPAVNTRPAALPAPPAIPFTPKPIRC